MLKLFFSLEGCINKKSYILSIGLLFAILITISIASAKLDPEQKHLAQLGFAGMAIAFSAILLTAQRLRDIGRSAWWLTAILGALTICASSAMLLVLCFGGILLYLALAPSKIENNKYRNNIS